MIGVDNNDGKKREIKKIGKMRHRIKEIKKIGKVRHKIREIKNWKNERQSEGNKIRGK